MMLKDLAAALGISGTMTSRLVKRGMPADSIDGARRWRKRHLNPMMMKGQRFGSAPLPPDAVAVAIADTAAPRAGAVDAVRHATELGDLAGEMLPLGKFASVEPLLRAALRAVPIESRASFTMPADVWQALVADVSAACAEFEAEAIAAIAAGEPLDYSADDDEYAGDLGVFWWAVAAGQVTLAVG